MEKDDKMLFKAKFKSILVLVVIISEFIVKLIV